MKKDSWTGTYRRSGRKAVWDRRYREEEESRGCNRVNREVIHNGEIIEILGNKRMRKEGRQKEQSGKRGET